MAAPFLRDPVDEGAILVRLAFHTDRVIRDRQDPLCHTDEFLFEQYRFSRQGLIYLQDLLGPYIANLTRRSRALTVLQTLCIALRFFASGTFLYSVGDAENIGKAAACVAVRKVYLALNQLMNKFIIFPGHVPVNDIKEGFYAIAEFPNVIGAVDCTHIYLKKPSGPNEADFVNRKGFHSLNVQMICDSTCLITNVEVKWPGSVHDSRIFRDSTLCHSFEQGNYDGLLIGDRGYACRPWFMTPYPEPAPGPEVRFNGALARTRARIEMTFGLLKGRFNCLRGLRVEPDRACAITVACAVLHNVATLRRERVQVIVAHPEDDVEPIHLDERSGPAARDIIA
ncbi:putative nuclease HARBI1 [Osmerus mordax]|uniref:putative nuclease HARBI1 n=1 Tax=Osmerus mordax TaxID=8014 RepID=UPI00350FFD59